MERAIEKELRNRLSVGTFYKNIYNLDKKDFEEKLDEAEIDDPQFEEDADEDLDEDEDDSALAEEERRLDEEEADEIEELEEKTALGPRRRPVTIKKERAEPEIEYEIEEERPGKSQAQAMLKEGGGKRRKIV